VARTTDGKAEPTVADTAATSTTATSKGDAPKSDSTLTVDDDGTPSKAAAEAQGGRCVVKSDFHVGRAVNGKVCSYHAMWYQPNGKPRSKDVTPR